MKKQVLTLAFVVIFFVATVSTIPIGMASQLASKPMKVDWHVTADIMPAPPYGTVDIPGSDTASKLTVTQPDGPTVLVLEGKMGGLNPFTTYQVMIANAYQPKGSPGEGWPGQLVLSVIYFVTDKHGKATWQWELTDSDFPSWLARPSVVPISVWINLTPMHFNCHCWAATTSK